MANEFKVEVPRSREYVSGSDAVTRVYQLGESPWFSYAAECDCGFHGAPFDDVVLAGTEAYQHAYSSCRRRGERG